MPSMLSLIPVALSFAAGVVAQNPPSGTVGGGAAGNTYPNCPDPSETCQSFGVDFHNGGSYFQDVTSTDPFTFATQFEGCQKDSNYNILVDPTGAQYNCTSTQLTPDNTTMTSTCSLDKDQLVSGDWSVILFSNNGQCAPFNAQRNFVLSVGTVTTSTVTPTVVFTSTSTPVLFTTQTTTSTIQYYAPTPTVTSSQTVKAKTRTVTPIKATSLVTTTLKVKTVTSYDLLVSNKLVTRTAHCTISSTAEAADPSLTSAVSVSASGSATSAAPVAGTDDQTSSAIPTATGSATTSAPAAAAATVDSGSSTDAASKRDLEAIVGPVGNFLEARADMLDNMIVKRAPDAATIYDIITVASDFYTSIITMTAPTVTAYSTSVITTSATSTPMAVTLYANAQSVVTLSQVTVTKTQTVKAQVYYTTNTKYATAVVTTTVTPSKAAAVCTSKGGFMQ